MQRAKDPRPRAKRSSVTDLHSRAGGRIIAIEVFGEPCAEPFPALTTPA